MTEQRQVVVAALAWLVPYVAVAVLVVYSLVH